MNQCLKLSKKLIEQFGDGHLHFYVKSHKHGVKQLVGVLNNVYLHDVHLLKYKLLTMAIEKRVKMARIRNPQIQSGEGVAVSGGSPFNKICAFVSQCIAKHSHLIHFVDGTRLFKK